MPLLMNFSRAPFFRQDFFNRQLIFYIRICYKGKMRKKISLPNDLIFINVFSLALAAIILAGSFWSGAGVCATLRIILGLPFVLFFPGYTLIAALFAGRGDLDGIERTALSFGLSIAVVPLIGLGLNYTPWGIRLTPILAALLVFIAGTSAVALFRRRRLPAEERFFPVFEVEFPVWGEMSGIDRVLSGVLALAILFAAGSIVYVVTTPKVGERFTEFYILGTGGKAEGYPRELAVGEKGEVIVGVVNHEYAPVKYSVQVVLGGYPRQRIGPIELAHEEKWEQRVDFAAGRPHENLKVEFLLYREGDAEPYRSLHLWVNVREGREAG